MIHAGSACVALIAVFALCGFLYADEAGKIMRPTNNAAISGDQVDIIATAPAGRIQLDGQAIDVEQPFPNVFHAVQKVSAGLHKLALVWDGGRTEVQFFSGPGAPAGFEPFHGHPPVPVKCTQCHQVNTHGRFEFKGGCFECHHQDSFTKVHTHDATVLAQCGLCHNAHGSSVKANLLYPRETACKVCHD